MSDALLLLSAFNVDSPLPGTLEMIVCGHLHSLLRQLFLFSHAVTAESAINALVAGADADDDAAEGPPAAADGNNGAASPPDGLTVARPQDGNDERLRLLTRAWTRLRRRWRFWLASGLSTSVAYSSEIYLILSAIVEWSSLSTQYSSFTESFFGLRRAEVAVLGPAQSRLSLGAGRSPLLRRWWLRLCGLAVPALLPRPASDQPQPAFGSNLEFLHEQRTVGDGKDASAATLPRPRQVASLCEVVLLPYLAAKVAAHYDYYTSDSANTLDARRRTADDMAARFGPGALTGRRLSDGRLARAATATRALVGRLYLALWRLYVRAVVHGYPFFSILSRLSLFSFLFAYAAERTPYFNGCLQASCVVVRRMNAADYKQAQRLASARSPAWRVAAAGGSVIGLVFVALRYFEWRSEQSTGQTAPTTVDVVTDPTSLAGRRRPPLLDPGGAVQVSAQGRWASLRAAVADAIGHHHVNSAGTLNTGVLQPSTLAALAGPSAGSEHAAHPAATERVPPPPETLALEARITAQREQQQQNTTALSPDNSGETPFARAASGHCVVCGRAPVNPAASVLSGAVGCYTCLVQHVQDHHADPLQPTLRATPAHIRRLFEG